MALEKEGWNMAPLGRQGHVNCILHMQVMKNILTHLLPQDTRVCLVACFILPLTHVYIQSIDLFRVIARKTSVIIFLPSFVVILYLFIKNTNFNPQKNHVTL